LIVNRIVSCYVAKTRYQLAIVRITSNKYKYAYARFQFSYACLNPETKISMTRPLLRNIPMEVCVRLSLLLSLDLNYIYLFIYLLFFGRLGRLYKRRGVINITIYDEVR